MTNISQTDWLGSSCLCFIVSLTVLSKCLLGKNFRCSVGPFLTWIGTFVVSGAFFICRILDLNHLWDWTQTVNLLYTFVILHRPITACPKLTFRYWTQVYPTTPEASPCVGLDLVKFLVGAGPAGKWELSGCVWLFLCCWASELMVRLLIDRINSLSTSAKFWL